MKEVAIPKDEGQSNTMRGQLLIAVYAMEYGSISDRRGR